MIKDKIFVGSIAGMIGTLFKDFPNFIFYRTGVVKYLYANLAASAHLFPAQVETPLGYAIGIAADISTGGAIGVVTLLFLERFGVDLWWFKGFMIGNGLWLFGLGVILNLGSVHLIPNDPTFRLLSLLDHWCFGLATVYLIKKWTRSGKQEGKWR